MGREWDWIPGLIPYSQKKMLIITYFSGLVNLSYFYMFHVFRRDFLVASFLF